MASKKGFVMTTLEIKDTLSKEVDSLPAEALHEVLDFVEFLKVKRLKIGLETSKPNQVVFDELNVLGANSQMHLEEEFADYKESYPHE